MAHAIEGPTTADSYAIVTRLSSVLNRIHPCSVCGTSRELLGSVGVRSTGGAARIASRRRTAKMSRGMPSQFNASCFGGSIFFVTETDCAVRTSTRDP
jgi:hypothetical protein